MTGLLQPPRSVLVCLAMHTQRAPDAPMSYAVGSDCSPSARRRASPAHRPVTGTDARSGIHRAGVR